MTFQVRTPSPDDQEPGPPLCNHNHPTIQDAWTCAISTNLSTGTHPVIYDVETERILSLFEIEDTHRQDMDDWQQSHTPKPQDKNDTP